MTEKTHEEQKEMLHEIGCIKRKIDYGRATEEDIDRLLFLEDNLGTLVIPPMNPHDFWG